MGYSPPDRRYVPPLALADRVLRDRPGHAVLRLAGAVARAFAAPSPSSASRARSTSATRAASRRRSSACAACSSRSASSSASWPTSCPTPSARSCAGFRIRSRRAPTTTSRPGCARSSAAARRPRCSPSSRRAGRVGVDRPGPPGAPAHRRAGGGQGSVPGHRGDRPHRPARAQAHLRPAALVHARLRLRHHLSRDPRDGVWPSSTFGWRRRRCRRSPPTSCGRPQRALPARHDRVLDGARADDRVDRGGQGRRPPAPAGRAHRSAQGGPDLRRGLLPADLRRRPLPRRSSPRESAAAAAAGRGRHRRRSSSSTSARRRRCRRGCGAGWCRFSRGRSRATPRASSPR